MNSDWMLLSSHGVILSFIAKHPNSTLREIARELGVTEMHVFATIRDMANAGVVRVEKAGRRNCYIIDSDAHFRYPWLSHVRLADFIELLYEPAAEEALPVEATAQ